MRGVSLHHSVLSRLFTATLLICVCTACGTLALADTTPPTGTPLPPQPVPTLSPDDYRLYSQRSGVELCFSPSRTIRDEQAVALLNVDCKKYQNPVGLVKYGIYGYQHPAPTICNAGNGLRTGILSFLTGSSIGNKNLITGAGTLLSVIFAGCNNATPQSQALGVQSPSTPQGAAIAAPALVASPATATLAVGADVKVSISEGGYKGSFTAISDRPDLANVKEGPQTVTSTGDAAIFTIHGNGHRGTATITFIDSAFNKTQVMITVP